MSRFSSSPSSPSLAVTVTEATTDTPSQLAAAYSASPLSQPTWLLPDGVVDLLSNEAVKQEALRYQLTRILLSYGYELISPPMIEYTESLLNHASEDLKRQTFKIIDQLTGRLMGVRADITPQIARIDAHRAKAQGIARYCYAGHVIYTLPKGLFGSRTPLQLGAEIFGSEALSADIELFDVLFTLLDSTHLRQHCHIDIGHVAIFETLADLAKLPEPLSKRLIELYANKSLPDLKRLTQDLHAHQVPFAEDFYTLGAYSNDLTQLMDKLSAPAKSQPKVAKALQDLITLTEYVEQHWQVTVSVDVTELKSYHYHTGVVFNVFVANESLPIVRGGRFVNAHSATTRHATGFSCDLTRWQNHIQNETRQLTVVPYSVASTVLRDTSHPEYQRLTQAIDALRAKGEGVVVALDSHDMPTQATHTLALIKGQWQVQAIAN